MSALLRSANSALFLLAAFLTLAHGAFITFDNCLDQNTIDTLINPPTVLQWVPLYLDAVFDNQHPNKLNVTIYGNVTGQQFEGTYPPATDPSWGDNSKKFGKITNVGTGNKFSTLLADFQVLTYDAYNAKASEFCPHLNTGSCPLGPSFFANGSDPYSLHSFSITHDFGSSYQFSTFASTIRVISGDNGAPDLACVSANITPDLGPQIKNLITWLPAAILTLKGIATLAAAIWSPWGSFDIFRWSSNYGRDEDLLRLVTPGFGDCLQYIQFVTLMGSLTLQYPGFFQPALSQTAWSLLLWNESFVSGGSGIPSLQDGIYVANGTYGIATMRQLIGINESKDVWACMAVFLAIIAVAVVVLCQLGFFARWIYRAVSKTSEEDLRQKNLPFTLGNMVRLMFNFFILPIVALSLFQLVIASMSPTSVVACAAVLFVILILSGAWILRIIFTTKPRTYLFDDMPTVLLYGPLYNTYSDSAAPFALIPVLITFMRGVAFGAVQPSGTAQLIILAICEVILILTLNGFRPFQIQTSMNFYHTAFAVVRLITVLLSIAFIPALGVTEAPKGWIGYVILLLHACVLVFGFFLNSLQTLVEVAVRSLGLAGHDAQTGATRGSILNWRMLKKRRARPTTIGSTTSNQGMLDVSQGEDGRSRSMSASSAQLLNTTPNQRRTSGFDEFSTGGQHVDKQSVDLNKAQNGFTYVAVPNTQEKPSLGVKTDGDAFYRVPRRRTMDALTPGAQSRSVVEPDVPYTDSPARGSAGGRDSDSAVFASPAPALAFLRQRTDSQGEGGSRAEGGPRPDYAVREVDQYYRGPALSDQPTRKLKTGPADPQGPVVNAQSWFQRLMLGVTGQKNKEAGKGFEVVRASRMPPGMQQQPPDGEDVEMQTSPPMNDEPYHDSPDMQAAAGAERSVSPEEAGIRPPGQPFDFGFAGTKHTSVREPRQDSAMGIRGPSHPGLRAELPSVRARPSQDTLGALRPSQDYLGMPSQERPLSEYVEDSRGYPNRISEVPSLAPIESVGGIDIPTRFNTQRTREQRESGSQGWFREIDSMPTHNRNISQPSSSRQYPTPSVPVRSAQRPPSRDQSHLQPPNVSRSASGNSSSSGNEFHHFDSSTGIYDIAADEERPSSFMNTSHHRAADSIHRNSFGANAALQASSAEFMAASPPEGSGFNQTQRR